MNALEQLRQMAHPGTRSAHAGNCGECERPMYQQRSDPLSRLPGMVERHKAGRCKPCYQRSARTRCGFCGARCMDESGERLCARCREVWAGPVQVVAVSA